MISVVSPVYYGEHVIDELVNRLHKTLSAITPDYEIILVDDQSPDNSWNIIRELCNNKHVKGIRLNKNYGQHAAIHAGLTQISGDWIVVMDCDLQDPPEEIMKLWSQANESNDAVIAIRIKTWQPVFKKFYSGLFYQTLGIITNTKLKTGTANFGIYKKSLIESILKNTRGYFFFPYAAAKNARQVAYQKVQFNPDVDERKSSYSFYKAFRLAFDILKSRISSSGSGLQSRQKYVISEIISGR